MADSPNNNNESVSNHNTDAAEHNNDGTVLDSEIISDNKEIALITPNIKWLPDNFIILDVSTERVYGYIDSEEDYQKIINDIFELHLCIFNVHYVRHSM